MVVSENYRPTLEEALEDLARIAAIVREQHHATVYMVTVKDRSSAVVRTINVGTLLLAEVRRALRETHNRVQRSWDILVEVPNIHLFTSFKKGTWTAHACFPYGKDGYDVTVENGATEQEVKETLIAGMEHVLAEMKSRG